MKPDNTRVKWHSAHQYEVGNYLRITNTRNNNGIHIVTAHSTLDEFVCRRAYWYEVVWYYVKSTPSTLKHWWRWIRLHMPSLISKNAKLEYELEWIDDHLFKPILTEKTREFIVERNNPEAKRLLRLCDLRDKEDGYHQAIQNLNLAAARFQFAANWIKNSYGGTNEDVKLIEDYKAALFEGL